MKTATRYWLFQIPGWVLTGALVVALWQWTDFPAWAGLFVMVLLVVKDALLYPFLRYSYDTNVKTGVEKLVGMRAVVKETLNPEGLVQVAGELWQARLRVEEQTVPAGEIVEIESAEGLTLVVTTVVDESRTKR